MALLNLVNIGSIHGLLTDDTKPWNEPILTYYVSSNVFRDMYLRAILQEVHVYLIRNMCSDITLLKITTISPRDQRVKACVTTRQFLDEQWRQLTEVVWRRE